MEKVMENTKKVTRRNISVQNKERETYIKNASQEEKKDLKWGEEFSLFLSVEKLLCMYKNEWLIIPKNQRSYCWNKKLRVGFLNQAIHGVLLSEPIEVVMIIPDGKAEITINDFIEDCENEQNYLNQGYRLELLDGSQRLRTLYGFYAEKEKFETEFYGKELAEDKILTIDFVVQNVKFSELPEGAQNRFLKSPIPVLKKVTHNKNQEVNENFDIINSKRKGLSKSDSMHNLYGETVLWQAAYEELNEDRTVLLLGLKSDKSHNPCNSKDALKQGDNGNGIRAMTKLLMHVDNPWMAEGTDVNSAIEKMSLDTSKEYDTPEKMTALIGRYAEVAELCSNFPMALSGGGKRGKKAENRIRSFFAAVSILNRFHKGLIEENMEELKEMFTALQTKIPSSQDGSARASTVNNEIAMYVAMIMYTCGIEDEDCLRKNSIEQSLVFNMTNTYKVDMLTPLEEYLAEKNKVPA